MYFTKDAVFLQRERKKCILSLNILFSVWQDLVLMVQKDGYPNERFELVTNFPRRKLTSLDFSTTLKSAGLFPQETVFVQERWHRQDKRREVNELCRRSCGVSWEIPSFVKGLRTPVYEYSYEDLTDVHEKCVVSFDVSKIQATQGSLFRFSFTLTLSCAGNNGHRSFKYLRSVVFNSSDISIFGKHVLPWRTLSDDQLLFSAML